MRIVIVGGGFAGVKAAIDLSNRGAENVTLISDQDYFLHHATLYATATGRSRQESVIPLKDVFATHKSVTLVKDTAVSIDEARKLIVCKKGWYQYDTLILALGVVTSYFDIEGLASHSYGIKTLLEVETFRNRLCEITNLKDITHKNYVIVGAGPTGVELAAALREYINNLCNSNVSIKSKFDVTLIEAAPRVLPRMSEAASKLVERRLKKLGVEIMISQKVEACSNKDIVVDGQRIHTETIVWTSGVTNHPLFIRNKELFTFASNGRVEVDDYLQAAPNIYVIGDNANTRYTGTAYTALHNAQYVAKHISAQAKGELVAPYTPKLFASTVPVGENWAIYEKRSLRIAGWLGAKIRRLTELRDYLYLVPFHTAWRAWRAHYIRDDMSKKDAA